MTLIGGISAGISLAVLGDGSIAHIDRPRLRGWIVVRSAPDGTFLGSVAQPVSVTGVAAHPGVPGAVVATLPSRGVVSIDTTDAVTDLSGQRDLSAVTTAGDLLTVATRKLRPRLLQLDPATGDVTDIDAAPGTVADLADHPTEDATLVLAGSIGRRRVLAVTAGQPATVVAHTPNATRIAAFPPGDPRIAIGFADGTTALLDLTTGTRRTVDADADPVWGLGVRGAELIIGAGDRIRAVPITDPPGVEIDMAPAHYLSSWTRARIRVTGGVDFDSLAFVVDPPEGGLVSASRDASFDPADPDVVVAIGGLVGDYKLVALDATTGDVWNATSFSVVDAWGEQDGPPAARIGAASGTQPLAAWGGGDPYVPQNVDVRPRRGRYRVAVVVVETSDQTTLSAADAAALTQTLRDEVFTGVNRGGVVESSRLYFTAVSDGALDLVEAGIVVPVRLPNRWDQYVATGTQNGVNTTTGRTQGDGLPNFSTAAVAEIVRLNRERANAGQPPVLELDRVDSLVFMLRSVPADAAATPPYPGRHQWPFGTLPGYYELSFIVGEDRVPFFGFEIAIPRVRTIQCLTMPSTWTAMSNSRTIAETVAHELGHNFGLHDAYWVSGTHDAQFQARELGEWDLMGLERGAPEMSVVERMMLGWVPAGEVRTISVGVQGFVDENVELHPASSGRPVPGGRRQAVELRIGDGHNYYFEYRRRNALALSDQTTPEDFVVVGTDFRSGDQPPKERRPLVLLADDGDGDAATFRVGDDYREEDRTDPSYPNDFEMSVLQTQSGFAEINLRYADAKPDPSIRPWAQSTNWKSPDLKIRNGKGSNDTPWEGHDNWIDATIRNTGRDTAYDIEVSFAVKDFTLAGGAEKSLGSVTIAKLDAGAQTVVSSPDAWRPPALSSIPFLTVRQHYCVVARITAQPDEIMRDNNEAQSNHTVLISASGSPSTRETGTVKVTNPHPVAARCAVVVRQTGQLSRTYLEHAWVHLQPGEERDVRFWTESMIGDPALMVYTRERQSLAWEMPNSLLLTGIADTGFGCHGDVTGGAHVEVRAGRRTRFVELVVGRGYAYGRVEVEEDGSGVWGDVVITLRSEKDGDDLGVYTGEVRDGQFRFEFGGERERIDEARVAQAEFLGGYSAAPAISEWVEVQ